MSRRTTRLTLALIARSPVRFASTAVLLSLCFLVFLAVQALSVASEGTLDTSVEDVLGAQGTYVIKLSPALNLPPAQAEQVVLAALAPLSTRPVVVAVNYGALNVDCPGSSVYGLQTLFIESSASGWQQGEGAPQGRICLGARDFTSLVRLTNDAEIRDFGPGMVASPELRETLTAIASGKRQLTFVVTTGSAEDQTLPLTDATVSALRVPAALNASTADNAVSTSRVDTGVAVRQAQSGVHLVYGAISCAIIMVAGLALLASQLSAVRERAWIYGLARTFGSTRAGLGLVVVGDSFVILAFALGLSLLAGLAVNGWVIDFGITHFGTAITLLQPATFQAVALAALAILVLSSAWPATRAAVLDPIDVLDRTHAS